MENTINGPRIFALGREVLSDFRVLVILSSFEEGADSPKLFNLISLRASAVRLPVPPATSKSYLEEFCVSSRANPLKDSSNTLVDSWFTFRLTIFPLDVEYCSRYINKGMFLCSIDLSHALTLTCLSSFSTSLTRVTLSDDGLSNLSLHLNCDQMGYKDERRLKTCPVHGWGEFFVFYNSLRMHEKTVSVRNSIFNFYLIMDLIYLELMQWKLLQMRSYKFRSGRNSSELEETLTHMGFWIKNR